MIQSFTGKCILSLAASVICLSSLLHGLPVRAARDGGDRGSCGTSGVAVSSEEVLTALVPKDGNANSATSTPKIWFYVPFASASDVSAKIILRDKRGKLVAESKNVPLPNSAGIMSLQLPVTLKKNELYNWFLSVSCGKPKNSGKPDVLNVDGWVRWIEPGIDVDKDLKKIDSIEKKVGIYLREGYWHDALTLLAEQRDKQPQAKALWTRLLKSEDLEKFTAKPIRP
jgi:hypothetical protein